MIKKGPYRRGKRVLMILLPLFFFSCASQSQVTNLSLRISKTEANLYQLNKKLNKNNQEIKSNIKLLRQNMADIRADMDSVREEMSSLRGYSEENRIMIKRIIESNLSKIDQITQQLNQISLRISRIEGEIKQIKDYLNLSEEIATGSKKAPEIYASALSLYKQGRYKEAILEFKRYLKKYPRSKLSDNAWFWIGECYMSLKKYEKAILAYYEAIKRYPKGNKVSAAMLRQAQAFQRIGDNTSAKLILKRLIKRFPRSNEAKIAKKMLRKM